MTPVQPSPPSATQDELREGEIYWIKVRRDQGATLNGEPGILSHANPGTPSENCWNIVFW